MTRLREDMETKRKAEIAKIEAKKNRTIDAFRFSNRFHHLNLLLKHDFVLWKTLGMLEYSCS